MSVLATNLTRTIGNADFCAQTNRDEVKILVENRDRTVTFQAETTSRKPLGQEQQLPLDYRESTAAAAAWKAITIGLVSQRAISQGRTKVTRLNDPIVYPSIKSTIDAIQAIDCATIWDGEYSVQCWGTPQKCELQADEYAFLALLGSERGRVAAEFLVYNKAKFGHQIITSVKIFQSQSHPQEVQYGLSGVLKPFTHAAAMAIRARSQLSVSNAASAAGQQTGQQAVQQAGGQAMARPSH